MSLYQKALQIATLAHRGQQWGDEDYMVHVLEVVKQNVYWTQFFQFSPTDKEETKIAAVFHDLVEDQFLRASEITGQVVDTSLSDEEKKEIIFVWIGSEFGSLVETYVRVLTDQPGANRKERKAKTYIRLREERKAVLVKLCDNITNIKKSRQEANKDASKLRMYQKEDEAFKQALYVSGEYDELWKERDRLLWRE